VRSERIAVVSPLVQVEGVSYSFSRLLAAMLAVSTAGSWVHA